MMSFRYGNLDHETEQWRLVLLQGAEDIDADIHCSLQTHDRAYASKYEALSYVWGSPTTACTIFLDGKAFDVTWNLKLALRYLRWPSEPRTLWIDAICIDQSNLKEKSAQLPLISNIFAKASRVLCWLGPPDTDIDLAFEHLTELYVRNVEVFTRLYDDETRVLLPKTIPGIKRFFSNPWWYRVWTAQELIVAREDSLFLCGNAGLPWTIAEALIAHLVSLIGTRYGASHFNIELDVEMDLIYDVCWLRRKWHGQKPTDDIPRHSLLTLEYVLAATSDRAATDPKDHVFATLGVLAQQIGLKPNYEKDVRSIYEETMVMALQTSGNLEFMMHAVLPKGVNTHALPSWCLDFSIHKWNTHRNEHHTTFSNGLYGDLDRFWPSGHSLNQCFDISYEADKSVLRVLGTPVGKIAFVQLSSTRPIFETESTTTEASLRRHIVAAKLTATQQNACFTKVLENASQCAFIEPALTLRLGSDVAGDLSRRVIVWKLFTGGLSPSYEEKEITDLRKKCGQVASLPLIELLENYAHQVACEQVPPFYTLKPVFIAAAESPNEIDVPPIIRLWDSLSSIIAGLGQLLAGRAFFATDTGYVGRADHTVQENDIVCVLQNCGRPAVLRPCEDGTYKLITFTYTHDVLEESETALDLDSRTAEWYALS